MRTTSPIFLSMLSVVACSKKPPPRRAAPLAPVLPSQTAAAPSSAPRPLPPPPPIPTSGEVRGRFGTEDVKFKTAHAELEDDDLEIDLTTESLPKPSPHSYSAILDIPPGPAHRFFVGRPESIQVRMGSDGDTPVDLYKVRHLYAELRLDKVEPRKGGHVSGTLRVQSPEGPAYFGGQFKTTITDDRMDHKWMAHQARAAGSKPATGKIAGKDVQFRSAIAFVLPVDGVDALDSVVLFPKAGLTCKTRRSASSSVGIDAYASGKTSKPVPFPGTVSVTTRRKENGRMHFKLLFVHANAWIKLDPVDLAHATRLRGRAHVDSIPKASVPVTVDGSFDAEICRSIL